MLYLQILVEEQIMKISVLSIFSELHLSVTWPCLSEDVIVDNGIYS